MIRKVRTTVTMLVLLGIVSFGAWYGWTGLTDSPPDFGFGAEEEPAECSTPKPDRARASRTLVSVYNAGAPRGTGGAVMDALNARGFGRGTIDFAPNDITVKGTVVWTHEPESARARLVARQFRAAKIQERANVPGPGVNVFVGEPFTGLRKAPRKLIVQPEPECS